MGTALLALRRHEDWLAAFERSLSLNRDYAAAWADTGGALAALSRFKEALAALKQSQKIDPRVNRCGKRDTSSKD